MHADIIGLDRSPQLRLWVFFIKKSSTLAEPFFVLAESASVQELFFLCSFELILVVLSLNTKCNCNWSSD